MSGPDCPLRQKTSGAGGLLSVELANGCVTGAESQSGVRLGRHSVCGVGPGNGRRLRCRGLHVVFYDFARGEKHVAIFVEEIYYWSPEGG